MSDADPDTQRYGQRDGFQRSPPFRCQGHQQRVIARESAKFADFLRRWIKHLRRIVRAVKAGFA